MARTARIAKAKSETSFIASIGYAILGSCFLALMSQFYVYLPYTPVPQTIQTLAVFLLGGFLGSRLAMMSVIVYLIEGTVGLPVFATGAISPFWFLDMKAGFLISFVAAAYVIGKFVERRPSCSTFYLITTLLVGQAIISLLGCLWLSLFVGPQTAVVIGFIPFIGGAIVKVFSAALILKGYISCRELWKSQLHRSVK